MWRTACLILFFLVSSVALAEAEGFPWLSSLELGDQVKQSGARLIDLPLGLHALEEVSDENNRIVIGVHGWRSEGYEWVYPLLTMDSDRTTTYFFRWDFNECPIKSGRILLTEIQSALETHPNTETIVIVGHSLGGILLASVADEFTLAVKTEIHLVASPLASIESEACAEQALPERSFASRDIFEWRTQHALDNAFNRLDEDPQNVEIPGSLVVRLPDTYNGRRLGHNWSISWVAEKLVDE